VVGGAAFVLDAGIVWALTHAGVNAYFARGMSLIASMAFTFSLNRLLTFRAGGPVKLQDVIAYASASAIGMGINYIIYAGCLKLAMAWLPAMVLGTVVASAFNFIAYGKIFKRT
jgi:putative flippase GtrA